MNINVTKGGLITAHLLRAKPQTSNHRESKMKVKEWANDSKKVGDYGNSDTDNAVYSAVGARNALRRANKAACE